MKNNVLYIMNSLNCGGEENFVMNVYRNIDKNVTKIFFCIPDMDGSKQYFEDEIKLNKDTIFKIQSKSRHPIHYFFQIKKIVKENQIKVVHCHSENSMMVLGLVAAKQGGARLLISHSHSSSVNSRVHRYLHFFFRPLLNIVADQKFACSAVAGKWMYGRWNYRIINNGIDLRKYQFNEKVRQRVRSQYGVTNQFVFGHVGRFSIVKNHNFLIRVFRAFIEKVSENAVLFLLGEGETMEEVRKIVDDYGIEDKIFFMGTCKNVHEFLQAMDCFLFPSIYEGLPVSLVEAQAAGLPCIVSDHVSKESKITSYVNYCPIDEGVKKWVDNMNEIFHQKNSRTLSKEDEKGMKRYDIKRITSFLEKLYRRK